MHWCWISRKKHHRRYRMAGWICAASGRGSCWRQVLLTLQRWPDYHRQGQECPWIPYGVRHWLCRPRHLLAGRVARWRRNPDWPGGDPEAVWPKKPVCVPTIYSFFGLVWASFGRKEKSSFVSACVCGSRFFPFVTPSQILPAFDKEM